MAIRYAVSLMLTRRYHAGGGSLRTFGSHGIRHATATLLVNNGMPLEDVKRCVCPIPRAAPAAIRSSSRVTEDHSVMAYVRWGHMAANRPVSIRMSC